MHKNWEETITRDLKKKRAQNQFRTLRVLSASGGRTITLDGEILLNFAANDYLGLATDPRLAAAGCRAAAEWGSGAGASRLISGSTALWDELENRLARWVGKERALFFNSGYNANTGLLATLADRDCVIFCDRLNHASIYDGVLLSRGQLVRYRHCDPEHLRQLLAKHAAVPRKIIITDAVFSMDGDVAPLEKLTRLAAESGALLIIDEAHSLGVFGSGGSGLTSALGLEKKVDIIMGTLGKACGVCGAFMAASDLIRDYLVNNCRPFIFTTALPPFVAGALLAALGIINAEERGAQVIKRAAGLRRKLQAAGFDCGSSESQIIPVMLEGNTQALAFMQHLQRQGIFAPAIRPPTVPPGGARVRLSLSYGHTREDISRLMAAATGWHKGGET